MTKLDLLTGPQGSMEVFSHYGIGIKACAVERRPDGRVEFTLWITVFWFPIFPLSSWSAIYDGPLRPDGIREDGQRFADPIRIHRDAFFYVQTVSSAIVAFALALAPILYFIFRTDGRGATATEMVLVFAACVWPVVVIYLTERRRRALLTGKWT